MVEYLEMSGISSDLFIDAINWAKLNSQGGTIPIITNQSIDAGAGYESLAIPMTNYHSGYLFVKNNGMSDNLAVLIESSDDAVGTIRTPLFTAVLNTVVYQRGAPVAVLPSYIFIKIRNYSSTATTFTIELTM